MVWLHRHAVHDMVASGSIPTEPRYYLQTVSTLSAFRNLHLAGPSKHDDFCVHMASHEHCMLFRDDRLFVDPVLVSADPVVAEG